MGLLARRDLLELFEKRCLEKSRYAHLAWMFRTEAPKVPKMAVGLSKASCFIFAAPEGAIVFLLRCSRIQRCGRSRAGGEGRCAKAFAGARDAPFEALVGLVYDHPTIAWADVRLARLGRTMSLPWLATELGGGHKPGGVA